MQGMRAPMTPKAVHRLIAARPHIEDRFHEPDLPLEGWDVAGTRQRRRQAASRARLVAVEGAVEATRGLVTAREVARLLAPEGMQLHPNAVEQWVAQGRIKPARYVRGKAWFDPGEARLWAAGPGKRCVHQRLMSID